jgi:protein-S-isoprenylcysteine O-methyltransferase Ste14
MQLDTLATIFGGAGLQGVLLFVADLGLAAMAVDIEAGTALRPTWSGGAGFLVFSRGLITRVATSRATPLGAESRI